MFNDFIKHYSIITSILRDVFLYGCFSREGLEEKRNISSRKISYEIRRIQQYVESEFIRSDRDGRNKLLALTYDAIRNTDNFLVKTYMTKSFTRTDLLLYFHILMVLNSDEKSLCFREIEENLIGEGFISYDNISSKTVERKLNEMCNKLGIVHCETVKRTKYYKISDDILKDFSNEEICELITAVSLFKNTLFPVTAGYYCESTLKDYLRYERKYKSEVKDQIEIKNQVEIKDYFQYKNLHFHPVIEEQILYQLLKAIDESKMITLDYNSQKPSFKKKEKDILKPYKIRYDKNCGRFYLVSYNQNNICVISRVDRIEGVNISKFTYEKSLLKKLYSRHMKYSWSSVPLAFRSKPEKLKLEIIINEPDENYIVEKIQSEVQHGIMERISKGIYNLTMFVNDSNEMAPWIRGYSGYINIIQGRGIKNKLAEDWKEMLEAYGDF